MSAALLSHHDQIVVGAVMLAALLGWPLAAWVSGRVIRLHRDRFAAYRQSCADAFDAHCDIIAELFPPVGVDELSVRRTARGDCGSNR